jgi:hypothetical protein
VLKNAGGKILPPTQEVACSGDIMKFWPPRPDDAGNSDNFQVVDSIPSDQPLITVPATGVAPVRTTGVIYPETWSLLSQPQLQDDGADPVSSLSATGFTINLKYTAAALAAPQSFRDGIQTAANIIQNALTDHITVNLTIDYTGTGGGAAAGPNSGHYYGYSNVRTLLINNASAGDHTFDTLPAGSSIQGQSNVAVWAAQEKLYGLNGIGANDTTTDDGGGHFATDIAPNLLVGVALHELTHAMGRVPYAAAGPGVDTASPDIFNLFRFTSPGNRFFDDNIPTSASYFSIDGGTTRLADYGQTSDPSDFLNSGVQGSNDPFNEFYGNGTLQTLTAVDLKQLDALGFHLASSPPAAGSVSINDVSITEGNAGTKVMSFTVTRTGGTAAFGVNFATVDGSATTADSDYVANSGTLSFGSGVNTQTISVTINGDTKSEFDENFFVNLSSATNGATISDNQGVGTILNDDPATPGSVSIDDVSLREGDSGTKVMTFTVSHTGTAAFNINFATANGSATTADGDYFASSGTLTFGTGVATQTVSVVINGDTKIEPNENFFVNLSGATNGAVISDGQGVGTIINDDPNLFPKGLHIYAGDFNGDGKSDLLGQDIGGEAGIWLMNGLTPIAQANVGANLGPSHHAIGAGDFNGDGKSDILWQNDNGQAEIWLMNGTTPIAQGNAGPNPGAGHHLVAIGDLNGDGKSDILWQNDNGQAEIWLMNGTTPISQANAGTNLGTSHHIMAARDFNGDGKADILWQNDNGQAEIWLMNGTTPIAQANAGTNSGPSHHITGAGDFNGDGKADILWQNDNGQAEIWLMNGTTPISQANAASNPGPAERVVGPGDFNGDGKADISLQNDNGQVELWLMDGISPIAQANVGNNPGTDWHLV